MELTVTHAQLLSEGCQWRGQGRAFDRSETEDMRTYVLTSIKSQPLVLHPESEPK